MQIAADGKLRLQTYPDDSEVLVKWAKKGKYWHRVGSRGKRTATVALHVLPTSPAWQWTLSMLQKWCIQAGKPLIIRIMNDGKFLRLFDIANLRRRYKIGVLEDIAGKPRHNMEGRKITRTEDERKHRRPLLRKGERNYIERHVLVQFYINFEQAAKLKAECERLGEKRTTFFRRILDDLPKVEGGEQ